LINPEFFVPLVAVGSMLWGAVLRWRTITRSHGTAHVISGVLDIVWTVFLNCDFKKRFAEVASRVNRFGAVDPTHALLAGQSGAAPIPPTK
jgi:hypothetical protein